MARDEPPEQVVANEAAQRIDAFLQTREAWNPTKSLTELSTQVAHEYQDRFVIELIQNGYDAHARDTSDGAIHLVLDESLGEHGVLYAANAGRPFERGNFEALTTLSQSNKPAGEGIGNKGLGFKSVLQVCEWPEVFSVDPDRPDSRTPEGYCFGHARDEDLRRLVPSDADRVLVEDEFARHMLPVPAVASDNRVHELMDRGAVTVVRLPLKSAAALDVARRQLELLLGDEVPVLLFLDRLRTLTVEFVDRAGTERRHSLSRDVESLDIGGLAAGLRFDRVSCGARSYLTISRRVSRESMDAAIETSIEQGQLDERWRAWNGDAQVAAAVPFPDGAPSAWGDLRGRMFTYLPMQERSPLGGHVNAPFYTKLARTTLDVQEVPLNRFLLREIGKLCLEAAEGLTAEASSELDSATVDLVGWDRYSDVLEEVAEEGSKLPDRQLVPVLRDGHSSRWATLSETYLWTHAGTVFTPERLSRSGAILANPQIGSRRLERLAAFHFHVLETGMEPDFDVLADWIEDAFERLLAESTDWPQAYLEIAKLFGQNGESLQGRRILIDENGRLQHAGPAGSRPSRAPTIFSPPRRSEEDDSDDEVHVPARLRRAIGFLSRDIPLRTVEEGKTVRTPIAQFLLRNRLVDEFSRANIITHLVQYTRRSGIADSTRSEVLRWTYAQARSARGDGLSDLGSFRVLVPTRGGWVPATQATFGPGWPDTLGAEMGRLTASAAMSMETAAELAKSFLPPPTEMPFSVDVPTDFVEFLRSLGVRDGLWPTPLKTPQLRADGRRWQPLRVAKASALDEGVLDAWTSHVLAGWSRDDPRHPNTPYASTDKLWVLPGALEHREWDERTRHLYALVVVASVGRWPEESLRYTFSLPRSHRSGPDKQEWPSPVATFLEQGSWFPAVQPAHPEHMRFSEPARGWVHVGRGDDPRPRYAPLCPRDVERELGGSPAAVRRLKARGLRVWDEAQSAAARLETIADLIEAGEVRDVDQRRLRRDNERAWRDLVAQGVSEDYTFARLTVARGPSVGVFRPATDGGPVYVPKGDARFVEHVLEAVRLPLVICDPAHGGLVEAMLQDRGIPAHSTVEAQAVVYADESQVRPDDQPGQLLVDVAHPALPTLLALAIEFQSNPIVQITSRVQQRVAARLRAIRVVHAGEIHVTVDDRQASIADLGRSGIHVDDEGHPTIVTTELHAASPWDYVASLSEHICELAAHTAATDSLRAACLMMERDGVAADSVPEPAVLAGAFRVSEAQVREVLRSLAGNVDRVAEYVAVQIACLGASDVARELGEHTFGGIEELRGWLRGELEETVDTSQVVELAQRVDTLNDLLATLEVDLPTFNEALRIVGFPTLHYPDRHEAAVRSFVAEHREELSRRLRSAHLETYRQRGDLGAYVEARNLKAITPDPEWLDRYVDPPRDVLEERVHQWLRDYHHALRDEPLEPLDEVRQRNAETIRAVLHEACALVVAWGAAHQRPVPEAWNTPGSITEQLHSAGTSDFEDMDASDVIDWLQALELWPEGMPAVLDAASLGLTDDLLDEAGKLEERERQARERRRRTISIGDQNFDTSEEEWSHIIEAVRRQTSRNETAARKSVAKLNPVAKGEPGSRRRPRERGGRHRAGTALSDSQRVAIGLIGELVAYDWLQKAYPEAMTPESWVSGYRQLVWGGDEGDDDLGYDFEVPLRSTTLQFEVKATPGDLCEFELGSSEVRAASVANKGTYRILFVRHALDPELREVLVLPNPLEPEQAQMFQQVSTGMRLRFDPS